MANDINDILGINLPKEEPASKSKIISDLLQNLVFSLGQGYSAQGTGRGSQARSAGIGAALQGPMVLQQIRQQQQKDQEDRAINIMKARELMRQGRNNEAMDLLKVRTQLPEETPATVVGQAPMMRSQVTPNVSGTPDTGLTVGDAAGLEGGTQGVQYGQTAPVMFTLPNGQQIPISPPSAGQNRQAQSVADARTLALEAAKQSMQVRNAGPGDRLIQNGQIVGEGQPLATPPRNIDPNSPEGMRARLDFLRQSSAMAPKSVTPLSVWLQQHPGGKIEDWIKLNQSVGAQPTGQVEYDDPVTGVRSVGVLNRNTNTITPATVGGASATKATAAQSSAESKDSELVKSYDALQNLAKLNTSAANQAMVTQYFDIIKPGSGARMNETEIKRLINLGGIPERASIWFKKAQSGEIFDAALKKEILDASKAIIDAKAKPAGSNPPAKGGWKLLNPG